MAEETRRKAADHGQRAAIGAVLIVLLLLGTAYWMYVRRQREYYTGRDLRVLRTMTSVFDDRIGGTSGYVKNWVRYGDRGVVDVTENCGEPIDPVADKRLPARLDGLTGKELLERRLIPSEKGYVIRLGYFAKVPPQLTKQEALFGSPRTWQPAQPAGQQDVNAWQVRRGCTDVTLSNLLDPVFGLDLAKVFDIVLLVNADGRILYSARPSRAQTSLLFTRAGAKPDDAGDAPVQIEDLGAMNETKGWRDTKPIDLAALRRATRTTNVVLADDSYYLFSQPYTFVSSSHAQQRWIVCGLVTTRRFRFDVFAVPAPLLMLASALALLGVCAWPYLRIALMNELEPVTISDAVLVAVCTIIAAAILTLALLDAAAYRRLSGIAQQQLHDFSEKLAADYARNVARAANALESIQAKTFDVSDWSPVSIAARLNGPDPRGPLDPWKSYPYLRSFAWVDAEGVQQLKFSVVQQDPRVNVAERRYFADVKHDNLWLTAPIPDPATQRPHRIPFAIQWVRSSATGKVTTVVAEKTRSEGLPYILLGTDLIDLSLAVPPPDVRVAIIDEQGDVIYHSEPERIGYENLFVETDQSPALRSAVVGRRAGVIETSYWGDNTEMYVRPLESSQWTLVVFRGKHLVRVLNEEAVVLTLLPLLLTSLPYLLIYLIILVAAPRYRAPSLWPDPKRRDDYVRLARLYAILGSAYALSVYAFAPPSLPPIVFLFPAHGIISTYVLLHRNDGRPRDRLAVAAWILFTVLLGFYIATGTLDGGILLTAAGGVMKWLPKLIVLGLLAVAAVLSLTFFTVGTSARPMYRMHYGTGYRLCGALLLVHAAAFPVVGFFKIASHIDLELYVKYAQLRMATMLEERTNQIMALDAAAEPGIAVQNDVLGYDAGHVFASTWTLLPPPFDRPPRLTTCDAATRATIPPLFPDVLPSISEDFVATRQLQEASSADKLWSWCSDNEDGLKLDRLIRLDPGRIPKLYPKAAAENEQQQLVIASHEPIIRETHGSSLAHAAALIVLPLLAFGIFWLAADFIARRLLLIDVAEPYWFAHVPLSPSLGDHLFVVRREQSVDELTASAQGAPFLDVTFEQMERDDSWNLTLAAIDRSTVGRNVRIRDFEYGIDDGEKNWKKLQWMERLLALSDRTVIVVSSVSSGYVCKAPVKAPPPSTQPPDPILVLPPAPPPGPKPQVRWQTLLSSFVQVTEEQLDLRRETGVAAAVAQQEERAAALPPPRPHFSRRVAAAWAWLDERLSFERAPGVWLDSETRHDRYLQRLAGELEQWREPLPSDDERERMLDEIGERARGYYAGLWASCSVEERILLYQIARNGLLNGKDRHLVRRLLARGFIRRTPQLEVFSETFRRFVVAEAREADLKHVAATLRPSRWKDLRVALAVLVLAFLLMLFATQKDILSTAQGLVTSLAASLPLLVKVLGLLGDRRADAGSR